MFESNNQLIEVVEYMKAHWPSRVKAEWQIKLEEYPELIKKVLVEFTENSTKNRKLVRIAGVSGSGKTTQLLPAAEKYFENNKMQPVLVAARRFVKYHPYCEEIKQFYGEENLRKMTDEFSTIMMFLCMQKLVEQGYDIILDVTLLDPAIEGMLSEALKKGGYDSVLLMIAASPEVAAKHLSGRQWRHTEETEKEFIRATEHAMGFYAKFVPNMRTIIWNVYDKEPVYDGPICKSLAVFGEYSKIIEIPEHDEDELREAKKQYILEKL